MLLKINKRIKAVRDLLRDSNITKQIKIYLAPPSYGDDYDSREQNYTYVNLNPKVIRGYVREVSLESLVWKSYGLTNIGTKEIICDEKYKNWFESANKIEIDNTEYEVFKEGLGNSALIISQPFALIKVILKRK